MVEARCKYFGECGGCSWQDLEYSEQLQRKCQALQAVLPPETAVSVHGGEPYSYRNRVDLGVSESGLGFKAKGRWWKINQITRCEIAEERINQLIAEFQQAFPQPDFFHLRAKTGTLKHVVIRVSRLESALSFVVNPEAERFAEVCDQINGFAAASSADHVLLTRVSRNSSVSVSPDYQVLKGSDFIREEMLGKIFYYPLQGFFQTNTAMAEKMQDYCRGLISNYQTTNMQLLDLYGGVGTFGIINAHAFSEVAVVENVGQAIEAAARNAQVNDIGNLRAIAMDAKDLKELLLPQPLFVITDPPRSGMDERTINRLLELQPEAIIYVSCNVKQLALDLPKLLGYEIKSAALFDLFPHTLHCEAVIELVRVDSPRETYTTH